MGKTANKQMICEILMEAAKEDKSIVALCSDSRGSGSFTPFADTYPDQFVETGIAEQNLVSIAAGLAKCGKKSYAVSPASFLSTRSYEQCKVDVAYSNTNVKLIGISGGISYGALGMANEYDLCFAKSLDDWARIEEIIKEEDIYGHLLSNHYCMKFYDYTRENLTHCSMQNILFHKADKWMKEFNKPIVYDECCYEGDIHFSWGNISAAEMVHRFWCAYCTGAFATHGETYLSEDDVLWWSKGGKLKGQSPAKIAFLRGIIGSLPSALEPWVEPEYLLYGPDFNDKVKDGENPFENLHASLTEMEDDAGALKDKLFAGHCGEEAFIKYYGIHCPGRAYMILPENRTYKIEVIDTWNETRETVMEGAKGIVWFDMPGKEKMAVMATAE